MEEQLSGACTVEIAAFNEFSTLLTDQELKAGFDHILLIPPQQGIRSGCCNFLPLGVDF